MENLVCFECGCSNNYETREIKRLYEGQGYRFYKNVQVPFCKNCGAPLYDEELETKIMEEANEEIRKQRNIISKEEMLMILEKYKISQKFLSKLLGRGEITLTRYINKNYTPSKENSDRLRGLDNPYNFIDLLNSMSEKTNNEIRKDKAFIKAYKKANEEIENFAKTNGKIYSVINWFLAQTTEETSITHLALQKILYFVQCWSISFNHKWIFENECQAWIHGAVYPEVYNTFKQFKYHSLPKVETQEFFDSNEIELLEFVKKYYFDVYNAKMLETICHAETPYIKARTYVEKDEPSTEKISKEEIMKYYTSIMHTYHIAVDDKEHVKDYLFQIK